METHTPVLWGSFREGDRGSFREGKHLFCIGWCWVSSIDVKISHFLSSIANDEGRTIEVFWGFCFWHIVPNTTGNG